MKFLLPLLLCIPLHAETLYVAQADAGTADGTSAANAHSAAWFNTAANWGGGAGEIDPGDTVRLVGTLTTALTFQTGGTAGNVITLDFYGAKFSKNFWSAGAVLMNGKNYLLLTDSTHTGTAVTNGASWMVNIEATDNGTSLGNQVGSYGTIGVSSHSIVEKLKVGPMYVSNPLVTDSHREGYCITFDSDSTDYTIRNNYAFGGDGLINCSGPVPGGVTSIQDVYVLDNRFEDFNHGLNAGIGNADASGQNVTWTNFTIRGNYFGSSLKWDNSADHHIDDIIFFNNTYDPTVRMDGLYVYRNTFSADFGATNTAAVFIAHYNPDEQVSNAYIHNNLFLAGDNTWGNGFVNCSGTDYWLFNNTAWGSDPAKGGGLRFGGTRGRCYNNILRTGTGLTAHAFTRDDIVDDNSTGQAETVTATYFATVYSDYNIITGTASPYQWILFGSLNNNQIWLSGLFAGLTEWKTYNNHTPTLTAFTGTHADPHSTTTAPAFNSGTYVPTAGDTAARGAGLNLTALFPSGIVAARPEVLQDFYGNARQVSAAWTIGAFEAGTGGAFTAPTVITTTLRIAP